MTEARRAPIRALATVMELRCEGGPNYRLVLRVPDWTGFLPGQFVMLSPGPLEAALRSDPLLPRPMAVYRERGAAGADRVIEILFKRHGRGTALLSACVPGSRVALVGPLGHGFPAPRAPHALLVAGGTGIASVYELAARLSAERVRVSVLLGARSAADLMGEADFAALGVTLEIATEDGSRGTRGLVTDLLEAALRRDAAAHVYACGPTPMMRRCAEIAAARAAACSVSLENPMACGFGACLGCAAPLQGGEFALVCRDGPVFEADRVDWGCMP